MSLEYMCQNCEVRIDPHMTKEETDYFLKAGCPMCHQSAWVLVEGTYDEWVQNSNVVVLVEEDALPHKCEDRNCQMCYEKEDEDHEKR